MASTSGDQTEQEVARPEATDRGEELDFILDAVPALVFYKDLEGRHLHVNQRLADALGMAKADVLGKTCHDLFPTDQASLMEANDRELVESGSTHTVAMEPFDTPQGRRWARTHRVPYRDSDGKLLGVIGFAEDMTESRRTQQALASLARFPQENPNPVLRATPDGAVLYTNPAGRAVVQADEEGSESLIEEALLGLREAVDSGRRVELEVACKGLTYSLLIVPLTDAGYVNVYGRDVTKLRRAQTELRRSQAQLRSIIENMHVGIALAGPDLRVREMNREMLQMFPDTQPGDLSVCHQICNRKGWETSREFCPSRQALADGKPHEMLVSVPSAGNVVKYRFVSSPVRDAEGTVNAVIEMAEDVTERMAAEEQLRESGRMEAIGRLAGGIAHDFNNLMTGVIGYTQLLLAEAREGSPTHSDLTQVKALAERAANLTRQLLAFSRREKLQAVPMDVNALIENMTKMLQRMIGEDIRLRFFPGHDLPNIKADPGRIEQVVMNIVVNARDAMPHGGDLTIRTESVVPGGSTDRHGAHVAVSIADTGLGMDEETRTRVFEPFYTTKDQGKGTGLGLATVYGIVKQHGGSVSVESRPGEGTTFTVHLPTTSETADLQGKAPPPAPVQQGTETVLLVEDEESVRRLADRTLREYGYTVIAAESPVKAAKLFAERPDSIDLLVTDVVMPDMSGLELFRLLRKHNAALPVLYMSGYSGGETVRKRIAEEGAPLLQKPFTLDGLAAGVRDAIDGGGNTE